MIDLSWWEIGMAVIGMVFWVAWIVIKYLFLLSLAAIPFMVPFQKEFRDAEVEAFYRGPCKRLPMAWLPMAGAGVMAAVAALPVGFANWKAEAGEKLSFWGGTKVAWTMPWTGWTFNVPDGVAAVFDRVDWRIPLVLAGLAFVLRIGVFKSVLHAFGQLLAFTLGGYAMYIFCSIYYAAVVIPTLIGIAMGIFMIFMGKNVGVEVLEDGFGTGDTRVDKDGKVYHRQFGKFGGEEGAWIGEDGKRYSLKRDD